MNQYQGYLGADEGDVDDIIDALSGTQAPRSKGAFVFAGINVTSVTTGNNSGAVTAPLNVNMMVERIVLGQAACVALSRISQISIGSVNLVVGSAPIPCELFRYDAQNTLIQSPVMATPSIPPTFYFTNATAGTVVYEGAVGGFASAPR